ncbi:MAG TPA: beta-phosphoglucomutase family hydrolase [Acidimicrobiales bacterium]|nr:beta-phosphoglucomutase family hydrolase [Acidimicrobiales bacterium]
MRGAEAAAGGEARLRLPGFVRGLLFDLDGVLTDTARLHATAWKETFDRLLAELAERDERRFVAFSESDYERYVDGRPRDEGVESFLASRRISLPSGTAGDPASALTVHGVANAKNERFLEAVSAGGVVLFPGSARLVALARSAGMRTAVVTSSANAPAILVAAGLEGAFDAVVDGNVAAARSLAGKPAPDTFLAAASDLGIPPAAAAVFEDALAGIEAGRAGGFGLVVGVDRRDEADALYASGADVVVSDLGELVEEG